MIPVSITLKGFRSYIEKQTLDFGGLTNVCIVGANGSGKSTLIKGMLWALFGKAEQRQAQDLISTCANSANIEFTFSIGEEMFRVERSLEKGKSSPKQNARLLKIDSSNNETLIAESVKSVNSAIENIIGMEYDSFTTASVILQGQADRFSKMLPSERKELFSKMLGLSICEKIASAVRLKIRELEGELKTRADEISRLSVEIDELAEAPKELESAKKAYESAKKEESEADRKLELSRTKKQKIDSIRLRKSTIEDRIREKQKEFDGIEKEIAGTEREHSQIDLFLKRRDEIEKKKNEFITLTNKEKELSRKRSQVSEARAKIAELKSDCERWLGELKGKIAESRAQQRALSRRIEELSPIIKKEEELRSAHIEFEIAREAFDVIRKSFTNASALDKKITEMENEISRERSKYKALLDDLMKRAQEIEKKIEKNPPDEIEKNLAKLKKEQEKIIALEEEKESFRAKAEATKNEISKLDALLSAIREEITSTTQKLEILNSATKPDCPLCGQELSIEHKERVIADFESGREVGEKRIAEIEKERENKERTVAKCRAEYSAKDREIKAIREKGKSINELETLLAIAKSDSENLSQILKEKERIRVVLEAEDYCASEREALNNLKVERAKILITKEILDEAEGKLENLRKGEELFNRLQEAISEKTAKDKELRAIEGNINELENELRSEREIKEKRKDIELLEKSIADIGYDEKEHRAIQERIKLLDGAQEEFEKLLKFTERGKSLRDRLDSLRERRDEIRQGIETFLKNGKALEMELSDAEIIEKDFADAEKLLGEARENVKKSLIELNSAESKDAQLKKSIAKEKELLIAQKGSFEALRLNRILAEAMGKSGLPAFVIRGAIPQIEDDADKLLSLITNGELSLKFRVSADDKDEDTFEVLISDRLGQRSYSTFSGGEAFRIDFALRLALSRFLARRCGKELSTIIVDEGFGTQDPAGLSVIVGALRSLAKEFGMIIVISHLERLREEFDQIIEITKEPEKGSRISVFA